VDTVIGDIRKHQGAVLRSLRINYEVSFKSSAFSLIPASG
jgi:hypothetical protein